MPQTPKPAPLSTHLDSKVEACGHDPTHAQWRSQLRSLGSLRGKAVLNDTQDQTSTSNSLLKLNMRSLLRVTTQCSNTSRLCPVQCCFEWSVVLESSRLCPPTVPPDSRVVDSRPPSRGSGNPEALDCREGEGTPSPHTCFSHRYPVSTVYSPDARGRRRRRAGIKSQQKKKDQVLRTIHFFLPTITANWNDGGLFDRREVMVGGILWGRESDAEGDT
jgi:hypothetical protein